MTVDLTPFGYTRTETAAYLALLELGPASGYAVAKQMSVARANAYQALNGLVAKGAAESVEGDPRRFRAFRASVLLARIAEREARRLELLERQLQELGSEGVADLVALTGSRAVADAATRAIARTSAAIRVLASSSVVASWRPAWRKRLADGGPTELWVVGPSGPDLTVPVAGEVAPETVQALFGTDVVLLQTDHAALAVLGTDEPTGYWTSVPLLVGMVRGAIDSLVA